MPLCLLIMLAACGGKGIKNGNGEFIVKYGNDDLSAFAGHTIWLRSWDNDGDPIYLFNTDNLKGDCALPYRVIIDRKKAVVKRQNRSEADSMAVCPVDTAMAVQLALKLFEYEAAYIHVDSNRNIFVQINYNKSRDELAKFSAGTLPDNEHSKWKSLKNGWYERNSPQ